MIANGFAYIQSHQKKIDKWKQDSQRQINQSILKKYRQRQYVQALDDSHAFQFHFIRHQTRYKQVNYIKHAYRTEIQNGCFKYCYEWIESRNKQLSNIGFECTLRAYYSKNQRKLTTRKLREDIMKRDNYTCQLCGKHMPDEIGLQIDHIIPIAKGGKTITSNLRVLCSKCNGSKADKIL